MDIANTLVAMIHDRVGDTLASFLAGGDNPFFIKPSDTLLGQLEDPTVTVPRVSAGFIGDIAVTSVSGLVGRLRAAGGDAGKLLDQVRDALRGQLPFRPPAGGANAPGGAIEASSISWKPTPRTSARRRQRSSSASTRSWRTWRSRVKPTRAPASPA
jgi:hypothetical protein